MSGHHYVDFLADTRRRDEEIRYANEHRAAKTLPARPVALVTLFWRGMLKFSALLISLGHRLRCRYESMMAASHVEGTSEPC